MLMMRHALLAGQSIAAAMLGAPAAPGRVYGPRVTESKNVGRSWGLHKRSAYYPAITAEEAPFKRECIRRRRQLAAARARQQLAA